MCFDQPGGRSCKENCWTLFTYFCCIMGVLLNIAYVMHLLWFHIHKMKSLDYHTIKHNISKPLKEATSKPLTHKYIIARFHIRFILYNNAFHLFVWGEILTHKIREISQRFIKCMYQSRKLMIYYLCVFVVSTLFLFLMRFLICSGRFGVGLFQQYFSYIAAVSFFLVKETGN